LKLGKGFGGGGGGGGAGGGFTKGKFKYGYYSLLFISRNFERVQKDKNNPYEQVEDTTVDESVLISKKNKDVSQTAESLFAIGEEVGDGESSLCEIHASLLTTCLGDECETPISEISSSVDLVASLTAMTGFSSFKPAQQDAVAAVMKGESTLVSIPTGAGKSLCYQLPAFILRCWFTQAVKVKSDLRQSLVIVVSPTISLMYDQMRCLPSTLRGACINSSASFVRLWC
jgi:superfamily II DNA helicase RecQ